MKKTSPEFLYQVSHLLDGLRDETPKREEIVDNLQARVRGLIHLAIQGQEALVAVGLEMISPEIEELVVSKQAEKEE